MENDWEILDNYEWVSKWFVWLRIFNNLINMIIWTFWTCSFLYTVWLFFLTKQMNFLGYYVFLYSMYLNVFGLVFLDDYLYFLDRYLRDEQRRIRIEKLRKEDERIQTELERPEVILRAKRFVKRVRKYPSLRPIMEEKNFNILKAFFFLGCEERNTALDLKIEKLTKELQEMDKELEPFIDKLFQIDIDH